ncbi:unnamed protein product [[Candida] boidinii]|nr:unnamed protein product [[Candida] boidinii]
MKVLHCFPAEVEYVDAVVGVDADIDPFGEIMLDVDDTDEFEFFFLCARFRFKLLVEILNDKLLGCVTGELWVFDCVEFLLMGLFISFNLNGALTVEFNVELELELEPELALALELELEMGARM